MVAVGPAVVEVPEDVLDHCGPLGGIAGIDAPLQPPIPSGQPVAAPEVIHGLPQGLDPGLHNGLDEGVDAAEVVSRRVIGIGLRVREDAPQGEVVGEGVLR